MSCIEKMDADCVIYNLSNPSGASSLHNMNLPNGSSIKSIIERIDQLFAITNPQANAESYTAAIEALGTTDTIVNTAELLTEIARQVTVAKQLVSNLQNYTQNQLGQINKLINDINNPAIAAGPVDIHDTIGEVLEKLGNALKVLQEALPAISTAEGNQLQVAADGGLFVKGYSFPVSALAGNALSLKPDGYYVNQSPNGLSNEQLMEMLINTGLNADPNNTLSIKFKQLVQSYL
jgi:hypothetical protein